MKTYDKLVRDRIPEIIRDDGKTYEVEQMNRADYLEALRAKVVEEAAEVVEADEDDLAKEIADLREVLDALEEAAGLDPGEVARLQERRRAERGGFEERLRLLWVARAD